MQDTVGVAGGEVVGVHALAEGELPGERPLGPLGRNDLLAFAVVRGALGLSESGIPFLSGSETRADVTMSCRPKVRGWRLDRAERLSCFVGQDRFRDAPRVRTCPARK